MNTGIDKILAKATDAESIELKIFQNAVIKNLSAYQSDPTKSNKINLDAAKEAFENKKNELTHKYFKRENKSGCFESTLQVLHHLYDAGYKISDSKIYRDKKSGLLKVNQDGTVDEAEVRAYASSLHRRGGNIDDLSDLQQRKTEKEVAVLDLKEKRFKFELDRDMGKYVPRQDFELELAARAVIFGTGMKHRVRSKIAEWVALVGGKTDKSADLMESLESEIDAELSEYATTRSFQVLFLEGHDAV